MGKVLLNILCLFFPFLAVLIRKGPCISAHELTSSLHRLGSPES
jgi:uncharacterized membrane protein YqaE (UPF0057 family)